MKIETKAKSEIQKENVELNVFVQVQAYLYTLRLKHIFTHSLRSKQICTHLKFHLILHAKLSSKLRQSISLKVSKIKYLSILFSQW